MRTVLLRQASGAGSDPAEVVLGLNVRNRLRLKLALLPDWVFPALAARTSEEWGSSPIFWLQDEQLVEVVAAEAPKTSDHPDRNWTPTPRSQTGTKPSPFPLEHIESLRPSPSLSRVV